MFTAIHRSPAPGDVVVVPVYDTPEPPAAQLPFPEDWRQCLSCHMLEGRVYMITATHVCLSDVQYFSSPNRDNLPFLPLKIGLPGVPDWFLSVRAPPPASTTAAPAAPAVPDGSGKERIPDSWSGGHLTTKSKAGAQLQVVQSFQSFASHHGHLVYEYTSSNLLMFLEHEWKVLTISINPANMYPVLPFADHPWYIYHKDHPSSDPTQDLAMSVLTGDFFSPALTCSKFAIRLAHFVPADTPGMPTSPPGGVANWTVFLLAVRNLAVALTILWHPAYGEALRAVAEYLSTYQMGSHLAVAYIESIFLDVLALWHLRTQQLDKGFRALGAPSSAPQRIMRYMNPEEIAQLLRDDLFYVLAGASLDREQQYMRQMVSASAPALPNLGLVPSRPAPRPRETAPPARTDPAGPSPGTRAAQRLCMQDMLHTLRVPNGGSGSFPPCSKKNCVDLHHANILSRLSLQRLRRAARNDPLTADAKVRDALLDRAAADARFYEAENR